MVSQLRRVVLAIESHKGIGWWRSISGVTGMEKAGFR